MTPPLLLDLAATEFALEGALRTIEEYSVRWNAGATCTARLLVAVEELFTNAIKYSYPGDPTGPVRVELVPTDSTWRLTFCDRGPAFDPTGWDVAAALAIPVDDRPVGQNGIALVLGMAAAARYRREGEWNRLELEFST